MVAKSGLGFESVGWVIMVSLWCNSTLTLHVPSVTTGFCFQQFHIDFQLRDPLFQQYPAVAVAELVVKIILASVVIIKIDAVRLRAELRASAVAVRRPLLE